LRWKTALIFKASVTTSLILISLIVSASPGPHDYFIKFRDKNNSPYSVSRPLEFLSARSLERRQKQHINIDEKDIPVNPAYLDSLRRIGVKVLFTSRWFNAATIETDDTTGHIIDLIKTFSFVDSPSTQLLRKRGIIKVKTISDNTNKKTEPATSGGEYGAAFRQIDMCHGQSLHELGSTGKDMLVAIIDAGFFHVNILYAFTELRRQNRIIATHNFVDNSDIYSGATHGMFVLSSIAGYLPGKLKGTAPDASFLLLVSENDTSEFPVEEDAWIAAAEYADSAGADLINSSLGYTRFDDSLLNNSYTELDGRTLRISRAAQVAAQKGILVMNSAGNDGAKSWHYISAPADALDILTVGAVDSNRMVSSFSSRGPSADGRIKPDVCAMGRSVTVADSKDSSITHVSGTSLSSPIITGLAACLWGAFPDKTNMEVMNAIRLSADHAMYPDNDYGYGIPDFLLAYRILKNEATLGNKDDIIGLFPNPFTGFPRLSYYSKTRQDINLRITDMEGRLIYKNVYPVTANSVLDKELEFLDKVPHGMYLISIQSANGTITKKLVKE
jgi:serine protease AprX